MFGLEEINLEPGKSVPSGRNADSEARAKAFANGCRWQCKRVKAWVNAEECVARYIAAKAASAYCPCLECSLVRQQLKGMPKKFGGVSHDQRGRSGPLASQAQASATHTRTTQAPARENATRPAGGGVSYPMPMPQKTIADIVKETQEEKPMSRPAKKRTADPIMSEVQAAAVQPALKVVAQDSVAPKPLNPFVDWQKYDTLLGRKQRKLAFVRMTPKAIYFSARCVENLRLAGFASLTVFVAPDLSGLAFEFHNSDAGTFTLSKRVQSKTELKISAAGLMRTHDDLKAHLNKKLEPIVHAPGKISILFAREVEA